MADFQDKRIHSRREFLHRASMAGIGAVAAAPIGFAASAMINCATGPSDAERDERALIDTVTEINRDAFPDNQTAHVIETYQHIRDANLDRENEMRTKRDIEAAGVAAIAGAVIGERIENDLQNREHASWQERAPGPQKKSYASPDVVNESGIKLLKR